MQRKNYVLHPENLILTLKIQHHIMKICNSKIPVKRENFLHCAKLSLHHRVINFFFFFLLPYDALSSTESNDVLVDLVSRRGWEKWKSYNELFQSLKVQKIG